MMGRWVGWQGYMPEPNEEVPITVLRNRVPTQECKCSARQALDMTCRLGHVGGGVIDVDNMLQGNEMRTMLEEVWTYVDIVTYPGSANTFPTHHTLQPITAERPSCLPCTTERALTHVPPNPPLTFKAERSRQL